MIHIADQEPAWSDVTAQQGKVIVSIGTLGEDWYLSKAFSPKAARGLAMVLNDAADEAELYDDRGGR